MSDLLVEPGTTVPVGTPLAVIAAVGAEAAAAAATAGTRRSAAPAAPRRARRRPPHRRLQAGGAGAVAAEPAAPSPVVRHRAAELGLALADVTGTGAHGRVTREDVERPRRPGRAGRRPAAVPRRPGHRRRGDHGRTGAPRAPSDRARVTPYARRLAAQLGVDLDALGGRRRAHVRAAEVRAAAAHGPGHRRRRSTGGASTRRRPRRGRRRRPDRGRDRTMRQAIARLMSRSKREIPHYYLTTTVDLAAA